MKLNGNSRKEVIYLLKTMSHATSDGEAVGSALLAIFRKQLETQQMIEDRNWNDAIDACSLIVSECDFHANDSVIKAFNALKKETKR